MSEFCGISAGIVNNCDTRKSAIGGLKTRFWLFNIDDIDTTQTLANVDGSGNINSIAFENYATLYKFVGIKAGNTGTDDISADDDGNAFFPHTFAFKIYDVTQDQRNVLEDLAFSDVGAIYEDANGDFYILGLPLGLSVESAPRSTGANPGDSTARLVTLSGPQTKLRKQFSAGTRDETIATLTAYES